MNQDDHIILAVHVTERMKHAGELQKVLSEFGCYIKTRLGLHQADPEHCSANGLIILELLDDERKVGELAAALEAIEGVEVRKIVFGH